MKRLICALSALSLSVAVVAPAGERFDVREIDVPLVEPFAAPERMLIVHGEQVGDADYLFAVVPDDHAVLVIDIASERHVATISTGPEPQDYPWNISHDPAAGLLYVMTSGRVKTYATGVLGFPAGPATDADVPFTAPRSSMFDPSGSQLLYSDYNTGGIGVISNNGATLDFRVEHGGDIDRGVHSFAFDSLRQRIIVPQTATSELTFLNSPDLSIDSEIPAGLRVFASAYQPTDDRLYVLARTAEWVAYIHLGSGDAWPVVVGSEPWGMVLDETRNLLYVGDNRSSAVYKIDGNTLGPGTDVSLELPLPVPARDVHLDASGARLYAVDDDSSLVSILDTESDQFVAAYDVGAPARFAIVDPESHKLFLTSMAGRSVKVVSPLIDPDVSEIVVDPEIIDADTVSTSRVTVTPLDGDGLPLGPGHDVQIAATAGVWSQPEVIDVGDGTYVRDLISTDLAETAIITATVDRVAVDERPRVSFHLPEHADIRVIEPAWGVSVGGTEVTITGVDFEKALAFDVEVEFGGVPVPPLDILEVTATTIRCLTPPHDPGVVDVMVRKTAVVPPAESWLRGGYTYTLSEETELMMAKGPRVGEVRLKWSRGVSGPVRVVRSTQKDMGGDQTESSEHLGPESTELTPRHPELLFFQVDRAAKK